MAAGPGTAQERQLTQNLIKARFVARVADYSTWPEASPMKPETGPFVIGLIGRSELEPDLKKEVQTLGKLKGRPVEIRVFRALTHLDECHILLIADSEGDRLEDILKQIGGKPVLTIASSAGFASRGIIFNLSVDQERLIYEMNLVALRKSGIKLDSRVLARAILVAR
jgi:hypothetical protein